MKKEYYVMEGKIAPTISKATLVVENELYVMTYEFYPTSITKQEDLIAMFDSRLMVGVTRRSAGHVTIEGIPKNVTCVLKKPRRKR